MELLPAAYGTTGTGVNTTIASQIVDTGTCSTHFELLDLSNYTVNPITHRDN